MCNLRIITQIRTKSVFSPGFLKQIFNSVWCWRNSNFSAVKEHNNKNLCTTEKPNLVVWSYARCMVRKTNKTKYASCKVYLFVTEYFTNERSQQGALIRANFGSRMKLKESPSISARRKPGGILKFISRMNWKFHAYSNYKEHRTTIRCGKYKINHDVKKKKRLNALLKSLKRRKMFWFR